MAAHDEPAPSVGDAPRVLAVDDQRPFLAVMRKVVDATAGFECVAEAESGQEAVAIARRLKPEFVLMDIAMPGLNGIEAARRIKAGLPRTVVVLVSATHPNDLTAEADSSEADEIVWKPELRPGVLERIWQTYGPGDAGPGER